MMAKQNVKVVSDQCSPAEEGSQASTVSPDSSGTEYALHNYLMSSAVLTMQMNKSKIHFFKV
jgi:hypothetical protein